MITLKKNNLSFSMDGGVVTGDNFAVITKGRHNWDATTIQVIFNLIFYIYLLGVTNVFPSVYIIPIFNETVQELHTI